jgi:hypothetical protein
MIRLFNVSRQVASQCCAAARDLANLLAKDSQRVLSRRLLLRRRLQQALRSDRTDHLRLPAEA